MSRTKAQRYDFLEYGGMYPLEDGDYVTAEDYEKLEQQRDELVAALKSIAANTCCKNCPEARHVAEAALEKAGAK